MVSKTYVGRSASLGSGTQTRVSHVSCVVDHSQRLPLPRPGDLHEHSVCLYMSDILGHAFTVPEYTRPTLEGSGPANICLLSFDQTMLRSTCLHPCLAAAQSWLEGLPDWHSRAAAAAADGTR